VSCSGHPFVVYIVAGVLSAFRGKPSDCPDDADSVKTKLASQRCCQQLSVYVSNVIFLTTSNFLLQAINQIIR
jgi:hypothetical protein